MISQKNLLKSLVTTKKLKSSSLQKELSKNIDVVSVTYLDKLRLQIFFSDSSNKVIDFKSFFTKNPHFKKFSHINSFKKFKIEEGLLVWGDSWELVFPNHSLHQGTTDNYNEDDGLVDVYIVQ